MSVLTRLSSRRRARGCDRRRNDEEEKGTGTRNGETMKMRTEKEIIRTKKMKTRRETTKMTSVGRTKTKKWKWGDEQTYPGGILYVFLM